MRLGDVAPGTVKTICGVKFIILSQSLDGTAVVTEKFTTKMSYGTTSDYEHCNIRRYCNGDFYNEFSEKIGKENILPHCVRLQADDGTGADKICNDYVSILTKDRYRFYRKYLPAYGEWWWLATRMTYDDSLGYARGACYVNSDGVPDWSDCGSRGGVRPFLFLNPDILVS